MRQGLLIGLDGGHVHSLLPLSCPEHPPAMAVFAGHIPHTPLAQPFGCLAGPQTLGPGQLVCNRGMGKGRLRRACASGRSELAGFLEVMTAASRPSLSPPWFVQHAQPLSGNSFL